MTISPNRIRALVAVAALSSLLPRGVLSQATDVVPTTLTLGDAARLAAAHSAQVDVARYDAAQAEAREHQRVADLRPNFSASAEQSGRTFNTVTFGINFPSAPGQPPLFSPNGQVEGPATALDVRGHVDALIYNPVGREQVRSAQKSVEAATANTASVAEQAAGEAAAAYIQVLRARGELDARTSDSTLAAQLLGIARDQLGAGTGIALDVTRAQAQLAGIRSELISARNNIARARLNLLRAVGLPLDSPVQLTDTLAAASMTDSIPSEEVALATAMRQRPDIRATEEQLGVIRQQIVAIRAERLPTLELMGDDGVIGGNALHLLPTYTYGIGLSVPLFNGKHRSTQIEEQTAASAEVEVRERDLREQVGLDVRSALLDLASASEQLSSAREQLALGEQEVSQARDRFTAGVAGNADVYSASLGLTQARTLLVEAMTAYQGARVSLARAEGTVTTLK